MSKNILLLIILLFNINAFASVKPSVKLEEFSSGYEDPLAVRNDGVNNWLYIVQRNGQILIADENGQKLPNDFLNISSKVLSGGERGLLGLAFHPNYSKNRLLVVNYTRKNDGATVIATYKVFEGNALQADPNSEKILLTISQPFANHNGGDIHFSKDGYLYIGMGDGGSGGDPQNHAQNPQSLLGKILRIDVNTDSTYSIPLDNPYVGSIIYRPEIWALGVRNPWRFSFDRNTDDLWIADVGQSAREEVNLAFSPRRGGENYGWKCYEGNQAYQTGGCQPQSSYQSPIFTYNRTNATGGQSITGGFVYRGERYPDLYGYYVCADYISRNFWLLKEKEGEVEVILKNNVLASVTSFGEDIHGELFVASFDGKIYRVGSACSDLLYKEIEIVQNDCPGDETGSIEIVMGSSSSNYDFSWSNGGTSSQIENLSNGWYYVTIRNENACVLEDSFLISTLSVHPELYVSGDSLKTDAVGTYTWYLNGEWIQDAQESYHIPNVNGEYYVIVNDGECELQSNIFEWTITSIIQRKTLQDIQVYPNPSVDLVNFLVPDQLKLSFAQLRVLDIQGKVIYDELHRDLSQPISLKEFAPGHYILEVISGQSNFIGRAKVVKIDR